MIAKLHLKVFAAASILASAPGMCIHAQETPAPAAAAPSAHRGVGTDDPLPCDAKSSPWWRPWKGHCRAKCEACEATRESFVTPLGETVYSHARVQIDNGVTARMVLYDCDFVQNSDRLSVRGRDQLARIALWAMHHPCPIIVERTPYCPGLDEARRKAVAQDLAGGALPISPERVIVAPAIANGLSGSDAEIIYRRMNAHTQSGGVLGGSGSQSFLPSGGFQPGAALGTTTSSR